jgi:ABC-type uncharacterized transport system auxiliary subunit
MIAVQEGEYPYYQGLRWADPDIGQAASMMREVVSRRQAMPQADARVIQAYKANFFAERIGLLYRRRLEELWDRRDAIQSHL